MGPNDGAPSRLAMIRDNKARVGALICGVCVEFDSVASRPTCDTVTAVLWTPPVKADPRQSRVSVWRTTTRLMMAMRYRTIVPQSLWAFYMCTHRDARCRLRDTVLLYCVPRCEGIPRQTQIGLGYATARMIAVLHGQQRKKEERRKKPALETHPSAVETQQQFRRTPQKSSFGITIGLRRRRADARQDLVEVCEISIRASRVSGCSWGFTF